MQLTRGVRHGHPRYGHRTMNGKAVWVREKCNRRGYHAQPMSSKGGLSVRLATWNTYPMGRGCSDVSQTGSFPQACCIPCLAQQASENADFYRVQKFVATHPFRRSCPGIFCLSLGGPLGSKVRKKIPDPVRGSSQQWRFAQIVLQRGTVLPRR